MTAPAEIASRPVLMSPELMEQMASRTIDGYRVRWEWDGPDEMGFWTPRATVDYTDGPDSIQPKEVIDV